MLTNKNTYDKIVNAFGAQIKYWTKSSVVEKYSRGWRGAPAKGIGRLRGARVQIPLSPLILFRKLFGKIKNEKNEICCWQTKKNVITYKSCFGNEASGHWQLNSETTLKIQKNFMDIIDVTNKTFNSKGYKASKFLARKKLNFNLRVWSWLRMNAGGVLNTCKSNEAL